LGLEAVSQGGSTTTTDWDAVIHAGKELTFGAKSQEEEMAAGQP